MKKSTWASPLFLLILLFLLSLACNLPSQAVSTTPRPTRIPTNTPPPTNTPYYFNPSTNDTTPQADTAPSSDTDLRIQQILLRYDPAKPLGNVEVTVCNWSQVVSSGFDVMLNVGNAQHRIAYTEAIQPGLCADVYDPQADFNTYGVTAPGPVGVRAEITNTAQPDPSEDNSFQATFNVPFLEPPEIVPGTEETPLRAEGPHEVLKNIDRFYSKSPVDYENFATLSIIDMRVCAPKVAEYLGLPMLEIVSWSHEERPDLDPGAYAGEPSDVAQVYDSMADFVEHSDFKRFWRDIRQGRCGVFIPAAHEFTHLYISRSPIPSALNEGLATLMFQRLALPEGWVFECRVDSWYQRFPLPSGEVYEESRPYVNLSEGWEYNTGMCFWDYIEKTYGHEKLQQVAQRLHEIQKDWIANGFTFTDECGTYFIRDILNPIVGEDVTPVTEPRFGVGLLLSDC